MLIVAVTSTCRVSRAKAYQALCPGIFRWRAQGEEPGNEDNYRLRKFLSAYGYSPDMQLGFNLLHSQIVVFPNLAASLGDTLHLIDDLPLERA